MIEKCPWWAWVVEREPVERGIDGSIIDPGLMEELAAGESGSGRRGD